MPPWVTTFEWSDGGKGKAESRVHYSGGLTVAAVVSRFSSLAAAQQAVSSAALVRITISKTIAVLSPPPPEPEADLGANLLLFYGNDTGAAAIRVPSPRPLPVDMVGPYRNVRLVLDAPDMPPLLPTLGSGGSGAITPGGAAWPLPLLAGGYTRYTGES